MFTIQSLVNQIVPSRTLLTRGALVILALGGFAGVDTLIASAPNCRHALTAGTDAHISLKNYMGSVEIRNGEKDRILVTANVDDEFVRVDKKGNMVDIGAVKERGIRPIDFIVAVPASCAVSLDAYNCKVTVHDIQGPIEIRTHQGDIDLYKIHSARVDADSINGRIVFDGDIVAGGSYVFDTLNNIDLFLPKDASFDVTATTDQDHVDLGGFGLVDSSTGKRVAGRHGKGGASVKITSEGSVHFHRR